MSPPEILALLAEHFPQIGPDTFQIEALDARSLRLRQRVGQRNLRPGGTLSGPTLMALADTAAYMLLLAQLGPVTLAVTTSLNIHFLRKPKMVDLIADVRLLRLGKRLAVMEVSLSSDGDLEPVAHATVTYAIPGAPAASNDEPQ